MNARTELRAIYRAVPEVHCRGLCTEACGPISLTRLEKGRLERTAGRALSVNPNDLVCSMLNADGRCAGYEARPLICRLFGAIERMRCPHGCAPARMLTQREADELFQRMERIGLGVVTTFAGDRLRLAAFRVGAQP